MKITGIILIILMLLFCAAGCTPVNALREQFSQNIKTVTDSISSTEQEVKEETTSATESDSSLMPDSLEVTGIDTPEIEIIENISEDQYMEIPDNTPENKSSDTSSVPSLQEEEDSGASVDKNGYVVFPEI